MDELDKKIDDGLETFGAIIESTILAAAIDGLMTEENPEILREACETAKTDPAMQEFFSADATELMANIACAKLHGKDPMEFLR